MGEGILRLLIIHRTLRPLFIPPLFLFLSHKGARKMEEKGRGGWKDKIILSMMLKCKVIKISYLWDTKCPKSAKNQAAH